MVTRSKGLFAMEKKIFKRKPVKEQKLDKARKNKHIIKPSSRTALKWAKDTGIGDIRGIDAPARRKKKRTAKK